MRAILAAILLLALAATSAVAAPKDRGPQWASLTVEQQQVLAPLARRMEQPSRPSSASSGSASPSATLR